MVNFNKVVRQASLKLTEAEGGQVTKRAYEGFVWEWTGHAGGSWCLEKGKRHNVEKEMSSARWGWPA